MSVKSLAARLQYYGGDQLGRINKQKLNSLKWALKNDYHSRPIKLNNGSMQYGLINELNLKSDYDKKVLSIEFDSGLEAGDTFQCLDDRTHWMVYLPYVTETAYLRSEIIRCRYTLEVEGETYWIYFQGPTETDLRWFIKSQININELNLSGTIYIKNNESTKNYFERFTHIKIDGHIWEVQVTDSISVPGVLELEVQEYYDNTIEELPEIIKEDDTITEIIGNIVVKPNSTVGYMIDDLYYDPKYEWKIKDNPRVEVKETMENGRVCKVYIHPGTVKPFTLQYGDYSLTVTIDWEEPVIQGPLIVYPYETHTYFIKDEENEYIWRIKSELAQITEVGNNYCKVEIITGRAGNFTIECKQNGADDSSIELLDVSIESL